MSNGGLLQKAIEQQSYDEGDAVIVADVAEPRGAGMMSGSMKSVPRNGGSVTTGVDVVGASSPPQLPKSSENNRALNATVFFMP